MKRLILILAAACSLSAGLTASTLAAAGEGGHGRWGDGGPPGQMRHGDAERGGRDVYGGPGRGRWGGEAPRGRYEEAPRGRYEDMPRGREYDEPRGRYEEPRGRYYQEAPRGGGRYGDRYEDAPPPAYVRRGFAPRPGGYLPPDYRGAPVGDYQRYRLRPPPRGYSWIHVGNGFALVGPDGQVFDVIQ